MNSIRFKNKKIFGTTFDAYITKARGHVMSLLLAGNIMSDGTVKNGSLSELWSYIYILLINNKDSNTFKEFFAMTKAIAKRFVRGVLEQTGSREITTDVLIKFINHVVRLPEIKNPISQFLCVKSLITTVRNCKAEANSLLETAILSKMCMVQYLADIMDLPSTNKCPQMDLTHQKAVYNKLPKTKQEHYVRLFNSYVASLEKYRDELATMRDCDRLTSLKVELSNILHDLTEIYDDFFDSVSVYVPAEETCGPSEFSVFDEKALNPLHDGYSIVLSTYGYGQPELKNLKNVKKIELYQAFELYYSYFGANDMTMHNQIILLYDQTNKFVETVKPFGCADGDIRVENLQFKASTSTDIDKFVKSIAETCEDNMRVKSRIKRTPLHEKSHRSHLFLVFRVIFDTGRSGFLTILNMASPESVNSIYSKIFNKAMPMHVLLQQFDSTGRYKGDTRRSLKTIMQTEALDIENGDMILLKGTDGQLLFDAPAVVENTLAKNVQLLYEAISIGESVQHMKYFFNKAQTFLPQKLEQYDAKKVFKQPALEDAKQKQSKVTCLMVPLLNYLKSLGDTKFLTFLAVSKNNCAEVLEFGKSIVP